jgi:NAD(P)-dependent dehydrogenase (short-subunit alcohol dehydrogenase family)
MENKLCVITGANSGIGFETTKELARQGAFVVMVCRNEDKAEAARHQIISEIPEAGLRIVLCDFSIQDEIRKAAAVITRDYEKIDVLINNHGFLANKFEETVDGLESTFAVNHIGYFLFTHLLLPNIKSAEKARIVNVASEAHRGGRFIPNNLQLKDGFNYWNAYGNSKLFNILFTIELASRLKDTEVTANAVHPGVVASNFAQNGYGFINLFFKIFKPFLKSNREGAETSIYVASSPEVEGVSGAYFKDLKVATPRKNALDIVAAQKLWVISEELCGLNGEPQITH